MAKKASKQADNTINIKAMPVQMHIGSQKYVNDDWGTMAYIIDRREIQNKFADPELRYNCIYFLFGYENNIEMCYVGQAKKRNDGESVLARLREHDKSTTEKYCDIWDWIVVVTNKNDAWTLDDLNALEHAFYAEIPTEQNLNGNNPNAGGANFDSYIDKIEQIKALVTTIGFSIFEKKIQTENIQVISETNEFSIVEDLQNGMARIPEIVTPHKVVKAMVDMLPADVWNDKTVFLDPACKGGEYLREIYDRLMENEIMQSKYDNPIERSNHILSEQLYGIALSQVSLERTTKKLMGFGMNIRVIPNYIEILKAKFSGEVSEADKREYIMGILNKEFGKNMKIDAVIGNPPYQEESGGRNATPLYNRFIEMGMRISDIGMWITPSRWFSGGIGLDNFRHYILSSKRISLIKNYKQANKIFNGVYIAGGVCITNICKHADKIQFIDGETDSSIIVDSEFIKEKEILLDRCEAYSVVEKTKSNNNMNNMVLPLNAFGLQANFEGSLIDNESYNIEVLGSYENISYISIDELEKGKDSVDKYKVICGKALSGQAGLPSSTGQHNVFSNIKVLKPNQICTFSYMVVAVTADELSANAIYKYIKTKFTRFLVLVTLASINISARNFMFVPLQNFTSNSDIDWSQSIADIDKQLYRKYGLSQEEIDYIEKTIKPME